MLQQVVNLLLCPHDHDPLAEPQKLLMRKELRRGDAPAGRTLELHPHECAPGEEYDAIRPPAIRTGIEFDAPPASLLDAPPEILLH